MLLFIFFFFFPMKRKDHKMCVTCSCGLGLYLKGAYVSQGVCMCISRCCVICTRSIHGFEPWPQCHV